MGIKFRSLDKDILAQSRLLLELNYKYFLIDFSTDIINIITLVELIINEETQELC